MKLAILALTASLLCAGDKPVVIHWDVSNLRLSWTSIKDGKTRHVIDFRKRTMDANGKKAYRISEAERAKLLFLIHGLAEYAVASEDWYERGGRYDDASPEPQQQPKNDRQIAKQCLAYCKFGQGDEYTCGPWPADCQRWHERASVGSNMGAKTIRVEGYQGRNKK
jgi:hypothetical protein